eukprot:Polyplicarium_translucidae@DN1119_c0_g1_i3.p2
MRSSTSRQSVQRLKRRVSLARLSRGHDLSPANYRECCVLVRPLRQALRDAARLMSQRLIALRQETRTTTHSSSRLELMYMLLQSETTAQCVDYTPCRMPQLRSPASSDRPRLVTRLRASSLRLSTQPVASPSKLEDVWPARSSPVCCIDLPM